MRIAYTMIRVADIERSIAFYVDILGMTLFRREDYPTGRFTLAFLGYGAEPSGATIELTWNWDAQVYDKGTGWGHLALAVGDVVLACGRFEAKGARVVRRPGPMMHASTQRGDAEMIAFIEDPDGYRIELVQHA
ncbi:lactoylglutathione lyase [Tistrella bauzanensis]|uniref:Aldoketomutase n=1 Tax=Tistrella bauzanensis TaxID=657419 RepID=A0ABQ1IMS4_9PROT|nr:lactoylglutathione lyase [Tistrella bauzanensis]GGB45287.1 lactoylglutathione lyase [Tistrella bauzanensis]